MTHAESEFIMGVWGAVLPVGSMGKAPGRGVQGGLSPLKLTRFLQLRRSGLKKIPVLPEIMHACLKVAWLNIFY